VNKTFFNENFASLCTSASDVTCRLKNSLTAPREFIRALLFSMLLVAACIGGAANANLLDQPLTLVDRDLPEFALADINGEPVTPETLAGKTWLINFWAVWCAPCLEELPDLNDAWSQLKDKNVGMLAINIGEEPHKIEAFLAQHDLQIDFPIVIGDKYKSLGNWKGVGLPYTVVVSPAGKVVYEATGPREWNEPVFVDAVLAVEEASANAQ